MAIHFDTNEGNCDQFIDITERKLMEIEIVRKKASRISNKAKLIFWLI
jgi:hypothetical protein